MAYRGSAYILFRPVTESFTADTEEYFCKVFVNVHGSIFGMR